MDEKKERRIKCNSTSCLVWRLKKGRKSKLKSKKCKYPRTSNYSLEINKILK